MSRTACLIVFVCVIAGSLADPATQLPCLGVTTQCQVSNVDITPCANKARCVFKIGREASISFDFIPDFDATELVHDVSTTVGGKSVSLGGFDSEACKYTGCPVTSGKKQTLTYTLPLKKSSVAKGSYDIKWAVWNKAAPAQICCFVTKIKLNS